MQLRGSISKWGNGQGIRLPKTLLEMLKWKNNDKINIVAEDDYIKIKKIEEPKRKNIVELFKNYDDSYKSSEFDWGESEGREMW